MRSRSLTLQRVFLPGSICPGVRASGQGHRAGRRLTTSARSWSCARSRRGVLLGMEYLSSEDRVELSYTLPLGEIIFDFFDHLKSRTRGYALSGLRAGRRAGSRPGQGRHPAAGRAGRRLQPDRSPRQGPTTVWHARWPPGSSELIPRQQFEIPIQAAIGSRVIARETSGRSARTCSPSATAVTSPESASCWRSRRKASAG